MSKHSHISAILRPRFFRPISSPVLSYVNGDALLFVQNGRLIRANLTRPMIFCLQRSSDKFKIADL